MKFFNLLVLLTGIFGLSSCCSSKRLEFYKDKEPKFNFREFYSHKLIAHGMYIDLFGRVTSRFVLKSEPAKLEKNNNLEKQHYKQHIKYIDSKEEKDIASYAVFDSNHPNTFVYKDEMMVGECQYRTSGNAALISYGLKIETSKNNYIIVGAEDWAFMIDDNQVLNKIKIRKFGIPVGEIIMSIRKLD